MEKKIYLDSAATTIVDEDILSEAISYFNMNFANASGVYKGSRECRKAIDSARQLVAKSINARDDEIYFTSGGTESNNWILRSIRSSQKNNKARHIITSKIEHHSVLHTCEYLQKSGYEISYIDVDKDGVIDLKQLDDSIRDDTALVSIMMANNEIGTIQPIKQISQIVHNKGCLFHTDAVQALGKMDIDVNDMGIDFMSISGHKIHAMKGIGALYIKKGISLSPLIYGGEQENSKRAGTENVAGIVSFGMACKKISDNNKQREYIKNLRDYFINEVENKISNSMLVGKRDERLINNINFCFEGIDSKLLVVLMDKEGIEVSVGSACSAGSIQNSHVIQSLKLDKKYDGSNMRFSISKYNTIEEIDKTVEVLGKLINKLRG